MYDPWDEFVMEHLTSFEEKSLQAAEKAELNVTAPENKEGALSEADAAALTKWMKETLGEKVGEVKVSQRLVDSPAVIIDADQMTASMRRIMRGMKNKPELPAAKQNLEINPRHTIITRLEALRQTNAPLAGKVAEQLLDNARVAAGLLEDPRTMLSRLNELLEQLVLPK